MLDNWLRTQLVTRVTIVDPHEDRLRAWFAAYQDRFTIYDNAAASGDIDFDIVLLAVKPQQMAEVLQHLNLAPDCLILTIAAGLKIEFYKKYLANPFVRLMPNTPAILGAGMTGGYADSAVSAAQRAQIETMMRPLGDFIWVDKEQALDAVAALSGSGPAYMFYFVEALARAGMAQGLAPDVAARLARQTAIGAGAILAVYPDTSPAQLRQDVTSKGGVTAAALAIFDKDDEFNRLVANAITANIGRGQELAQQQ